MRMLIRYFSPSQDAPRTYIPARPRLGSQLKSFISSFKTSSAAHTPTEEKEDEMSKARSSDDERDDWRYHANAGQGSSRPAPSRPKALVMPAARPAGPDGLAGLNDDSPPLTPASDEAKDSESSHFMQELTRNSSLRHPWAAAQARADVNGTLSSNPSSSMDRDCMTPISTSTITSGRSSPLLSSLSVGSSVGTYIPSRPTSSLALFKLSSSPFSALLPSHTISPSESPPPPEHATKAYWRATPTTSIFSNLLSRLSLALSNTRLPPLRRHLPALVFLLTAFIGSTMCVILALSTLPLHLPTHITDLQEIRDMSLNLQVYSQSSNKAFLHTLSVLAAFYTWKQSFTIPGSLIMNVIFGMTFGVWRGTIVTSLLTSLGGVFCYLLVSPISPLIHHLPGLHTVLEKLREAMNKGGTGKVLSRHSRPLTTKEQEMRQNRARQSNLWSYLLILRVLPIMPYGLMNIACSVLRVPLLPYAVTLAVGSIPWNACTVQVGDLLVQVVSALDGTEAGTSFSLDGGDFHAATLHGKMTGPKITAKTQSGTGAIAAKLWNKEMMFKLVLMSLVSLAPLLLQRYLNRDRDEEDSNLIDEEDDERVLTELDQEAATAVGENDDYAGQQKRHSLLPAWKPSWSNSSLADVAAAATTFCQNKQQTPPPLSIDTSPIKRFSGVWTVNAEERMMAANRTASPSPAEQDAQARRYPSLKRAVAVSRVG